MLVLNSFPYNELAPVTITRGIQPAGVVTMTMKVLYITTVTCALVIYLICMPMALRVENIHIRQIPHAHVITIS